MTNKPKKSAAIVKTIKKSAKALLSGKKDVKRLAAALPLTAILVEEVRAAQSHLGPVELTAKDALDSLALETQTTELEPQQAQLEEALTDEQVAELQDDVHLEVTRSERDLLLAQADTAPPGGAATISDAGASAGAGAGAAAAPFELSALPLAGAGIAPIAGALGLGAVAANNAAGTAGVVKTYTFAIVKAVDDQAAVDVDVSKNGVTNDETPTLVGTAPPGSVIVISEAGIVFGSVVADAEGNWRFTSKLKQAQGEHVYTASMLVDEATTQTLTFNLTIDSFAPSAPFAPVIAENNNGVINLAEAANGTEVEVNLTGTNALEGDKVTVTIDGVDTVYTLLAGDITAGKAMVGIAKSVLDAAGQGSATVTTFITDAAGNSSAISAATTLNIDTVAPDAPLLLTVTDDFGSTTGVVSAKVITDDTMPTFQGTGAPGDTITIFDGVTQLGTTQVLPNGTWTFTATNALSAGVHSITSQATDTAGNIGLASAAVEFVIGALSITETQASTALAQGLSFAAADRAILAQADDNLSLSLKQLQKLGIDAVSVAGVVGDLNLDLGAGSALTAGALPVLGDSDNNGALSAAEDAALNVSLNVDSLAQINELSSLSTGLAASGIDNVNLHLADQTALDAVFADSGFGTSFDSFIAAGLNASIDMTNNLASLNAAQASSMIAEGLHFASNDIVDVQFDTAQGTHLSTSLKDLQKLGIDAVGIGGGGGFVSASAFSAVSVPGISLDLGSGASTLSASGLPKFGDANQDGTLSAAEDAALNVTLDVANLSQLHEVAGVSGLAGLGIDDVSLNFTNQAAFDTAFGANSSLVADLSALHTAGLNTGTIDMVSNAATLSATQAHALVVDGLHFAGADSITVNADGTHLSTSLKELQKLGVDAVSFAAGGDTHVGLDLGDFNNFDAISFNGLPVFDTALDVTLGVNSLDQLHGITTAAVEAALSSANIDSIQLNVADQAAFDSVWSSSANTSAFASDLASLHTAGLDVTTLDVGGSFINSQIHLSELQGATLNTAGLHFAANDFVSMDVTAAQGTHLNTSMADLHKLGVDTLTITDGEHITDLGVMANSLTSHGIAHLGLSSSDMANSTVTAGSTLAQKVGTFDWAHSGIDFALDVDSNVSSLVAMLENGVDVFNGQALSNTAKWGDLMGALHQSGLGSINLQNTATTSAASANVVVSDELTGALYDAGMLHALPNANITLDVGTNKVLQTSLKAMLDLGVDKVQTDHKVYVDLGLDSATAHDMQGLFASFNYDTSVPADGLFGGKAAGLVVDQATFNTMGASDVHTLVQQLSKLGITEIDVLNDSVVTHAYQITAQTQVLSQVDILGTSTAGTDLAVFDTDILHKTIKA
nr:Ig-like domain-containing protein [uncultured Limnohabitans sp.]